MDLVITILLGVLMLLMTVYGGYVSAKNRKQQIVFCSIGFVCLFLHVVYSILNSNSQRDLRDLMKKQQNRLESIDQTGKNIASDIKKFVPKGTESGEFLVPPVPSKEAKKLTKPEDESLKNVERGISELKSLIAGQTWGLNAEQLISLSRRMSSFAKPEDRGDLITCVLGDSDSTKFAVNLVGAFRTAGWQLPGSGFNQTIFSGNPT
ncbi:MAG TPA: hypothetical protein VF369_07190, partial [candidate division Zixibacteria bacterium]